MLRCRIADVAAVLLVAALLLTGCGGGGGSAGPPPPAPTVSLASSATDVQANGSVTLSWSSTNASACTASGGWSGALATSGSKVQTVTATGAFTLTCSGGGGTGTASTSVTAWHAPAPTIAADVTAILPNNTVTLTWSAPNATTCTGADALSGALATSGSQTTATLATTTVFSVACVNPTYTAVTASVTVTVSSTFTATLSVQYEVPGAPVLNTAHSYYVPDWAHSITHPVPFVWVEMQDPVGHVAAAVWADAAGVATLAGLDPAVTYTPVIRSRINDAVHGFDFVVLNNTAPVDTAQPTYRARYAAYANAAPAYTPGTRLAVQSVGTITALDGWDATAARLVDANRVAAPYALLAAAVYEAQIVTAAIGGTPTWRPLTILWSTLNKGGLAAPPDQMDNGYATSAGYYNSTHPGVDPSGLETLPSVAEDLEFISGDQTTEPMDVYPYVLTHEMGHFTQSLFSTRDSPGYIHAYSDYEDPTQAWIEGNASGIAALVLNTPLENRVGMIGGQLVINVVDPSTYTVSGNPQNWPIGWYQEASVVRLMWKLYDPAGTIKLSAASVLAPMYTAAWKTGPWLNTPWAYTAQLAKANASNASAIGTLADSLNIKSTGDDEWGTIESSLGNRTAKDALPPYVTVAVGGAAATACSAGAANDYNKESNVRYVKVTGGNGASHVLTITGASGTVPLLNGTYLNPGANVLSGSVMVPVGVSVLAIGDCTVSGSPFATDTAVCSETLSPPAEQCWTVSIQ